MSVPPKNSAEVAIKLYDEARKLGIPARIEASMVLKSDSRYVILFPGTVEQATIRISSHKPYEERYALCIDVSRSSLLDVAVPIGVNWMGEKYGDGALQAIAARGGLATPDVPLRRRFGDGYLRSQQRDDLSVPEPHGDGADRVRNGSAKRVRNAGAFSQRTRREKQRLRAELSGDC